MRRTEVRKERQRSLTKVELRGQTILCYVRVGSAVVRGKEREGGVVGKTFPHGEEGRKGCEVVTLPFLDSNYHIRIKK